jgi:hypothetical protein
MAGQKEVEMIHSMSVKAMLDREEKKQNATAKSGYGLKTVPSFEDTQ